MPESHTPLAHKLSTSSISSSSSASSSHHSHQQQQHHISRVGSVSGTMSPNSQLEHEKRVRREIANSNERRRMQSINTGFQSLKVLIPHSCGEKLSKACILQRAADHIKSLETEKLKLQSQNEQFRLLIKSFQIDSTTVLQAQRRLSTNDPDDAVLLLGGGGEGMKSGGGAATHHEVELSAAAELIVAAAQGAAKGVAASGGGNGNDEHLRLLHDVKNRQALTHWQTFENVAQYMQSQSQKDEHSISKFYSSSHSSSSAAYRGSTKQQQLSPATTTTSPEPSPPNVNTTTTTATQSSSSNVLLHQPSSDTAYMILKQAVIPLPGQRCYKTGSLDTIATQQHAVGHLHTHHRKPCGPSQDLSEKSGIILVDRCHLRAQSVDTNNNSSVSSEMSVGSSSAEQTAVARRNLQTIVEAIRHVEGEDAMNVEQQSSLSTYSSSSRQPHYFGSTQDMLPAPLCRLISEKFVSSNQHVSPQTINICSHAGSQQQQHSMTPPTVSVSASTCHDIDLNQKPPKKRKYTYNESDDTEQQPSIKLSASPDRKHDLPPIQSPDVHHHIELSTSVESPRHSSPPSRISNLVLSTLKSSPSTVVDQLFQNHPQRQQATRLPPPLLLPPSSHRQHQQP